MKFNLVNISRLLVGSLFIVSGLIKANDPLGFSYKLEEYFAFDVLNWTIFQGTEMVMAAFISVSEIVLGVALLAGEKIKLTSWLLLLMIVFFTFLTGYTAIGNWFFENQDASLTHTFESMLGFQASDIHYFKDCGCFGDAIKFTPWNSFEKDLILLFFIIVLFLNRSKVKPNTTKENRYFYGLSLLLISVFSVGMMHWWFPIIFTMVLFWVGLIIKHKMGARAGWYMALFAFLYTSLLPIYALNLLPQKDFRPFAIGQNINEGISVPEGEEPPLYGVDYTMRNKQTGKDTIVSSVAYLDNKVWENKDLEIVETSKSYLIREGYEPPIHDFVLESFYDGSDYTEFILDQPFALLFISYDMEMANTGNMDRISQLTADAMAANLPVYGLTASGYDIVEHMRQQYALPFDFYTCDGTTLKTIIRSNPGLVLLKRGTVIAKWPNKAIPGKDTIEKLIKN